MRCPTCQADLLEDSRFCGTCGRSFVATETQGEAKMPPAPRPDMIGREIASGRYRITAKLGEGGMGEVFRADQISLKRAVALKLLRPEMSQLPALMRRFIAEAELVAKLSHPNTVSIYDFGQHTDGALFIAMELIEGTSLRAVLRDTGALPPPRALAIAAQIAASLTDAHAHAIIHRDLKPDNVMLQERGRERDVVRVLDFGIAKLRDGSRTTQQQMTQAGDMLGTPQYMAPEQIRSEPIDGRTDVYALGCILYEMLTARMPFEAPTVMAMLGKHLTEAPLPPSRRRPDLPISPALDELVLHAMQKDPAARPPTMEAFGERIAALQRTHAADTSPGPAPAAWIPPMGYAGFEERPPAAPEPLPVPRVPLPPSIPLGYGGVTSSGGAVGGLAAARAAAGPTEMVDPLPRPALVRGPHGMVVTTLPPAAKSSHVLVIVLAVVAGLCVVGVGVGVLVAKQRAAAIEVREASDPWAAGSAEAPAPAPPAGLPTALTDVPVGAAINPPYNATRLNDVPVGQHWIDPSHGTDYWLSPLEPGTNDPPALANRWMAEHMGSRLVGIQQIESAGEMRPELMFSQDLATPSGPLTVSQLIVLYITPRYRVGVVVQVPVIAFTNDASLYGQIDAFIRAGVTMP